MDLTVPDHLPIAVKNQLLELINEYQEELITFKGYNSKRDKLLQECNSANNNDENDKNYNIDHRPSILSFDPIALEASVKQKHLSSNGSINTSPISSSTNIKILQRMKSTYLMDSHSINSTRNKLTRQNTTVSLPLNHSSLAKFGYEPTTPLFPRTFSSKNKSDFVLPNTSLSSILSKRSEQHGKELAIISVNSKGKEKAVTWSKLFSKSNKITNELDNEVSHMSKVLLWYKSDDVIDFASALFACFNADLVPIPVNLETYKLDEIEEIIHICDSRIVLISNECHQILENMTDKLEQSKETNPWANLKFIKTTDMGTSSKSKKIYQAPSISYIEFTRTPLGILSGVIMRYKTLETQFSSLATILNSRVEPLDSKQGFSAVVRPLNEKKFNAVSKPLKIVSTMDPTRSTGLIHGLLFSIYSGNVFISCDFSSVSNTPGELEKLVGKYRGNMLLIDQLQLKQVVLNYLDNPLLTKSKKQQSNKKIDLSCVKFCLSSCNNIDDETSDMIVNKWLNNLGCLHSSRVYSPMLTLTDFGGIFVSLRDELEGTPHKLNENVTDEIDNDYDDEDVSFKVKKDVDLYSDVLANDDTVFVEKKALKDNEIKIATVEQGLTYPEQYLKVSSFGYPIPNVTTCVVSPDHKILSPKNIVGEIWISNDILVNEFYQLPKINDFVFNAKLDFSKMNHIINSFDGNNLNSIKMAEITQAIQHLKANTFLRTKLVGFQHNNKIYILSSIDDVILQNKLYRLPNGKHTSDKSKVPKSLSSKNSGSKKSKQSLSNEEDESAILETHYLQHISATLISMSNSISEISCFELPTHKDEHFLILLFETPLLKKTTKLSAKVDKQLVPLVNNIYKLLWKFHNIQPFLIMAVPEGGLKRRYCSLEIANSFVERQFYNGQLDIKYLKFQLDNVLMDHLPKPMIEVDEKKINGEVVVESSLFNSRVSFLRNLLLKEAIVSEVTSSGSQPINEIDLMLFEQDLRKSISSKATIDERNGIDISKKFSNILELLEYRIKNQPNELAFSDGFVNSNKKSNSNNYHKAVSWKFLSNMISSYMKKISESKSPLKSGDCVIVMCDNSVEYVAIILTCIYFGFNIIPMVSLSNKNKSVEKTCQYLVAVVKAFKVKRIFVDYKNHTLLEDTNTLTGKHMKKSKLKLKLCKITLFSKNKIKTTYSLDFFKRDIAKKTGKHNKSKIVFLNEKDSLWNMTTTYTLNQLFKLCSVYKDTFNLNYSSRNISVINHTQHIGFMKSCMLGIFLGASTTLYSLNDIKNDCKDFFQDLMHLNLNEIYLNRDLFAFILIKSFDKKIKKIFQNIPHILIPYAGRPNHIDLLRLSNRYGLESGCTMRSLNFIYENKFNPFISCRKDEPIILNLESTSLRNGVIKEVFVNSKNKASNIIPVYDIGSILDGHLKVINPETLQPTYLTEIGEIVVSSQLNVSDYNSLSVSTNKINKNDFFNEQLEVVIEGEKFIRTGDLGFLKPYLIDGNQENIIFNLGNIDTSIEHNGLHFVFDLENSILETNYSLISKCMCVKVGGYTAALIQMKGVNNSSSDASSPKMIYNEANLAPMIATKLLLKHKFLLNMIVFVDYIDTKNRHLTLNKFINSKDKDYIFGIYA
ncbi:hypothetical protein HANVADRAFT_39493 [Hanseniaspora valbyensis NRRL Y-1626]|uniref:DMAP1-binding domain-containing protein n=1 Tax=Hanseniaspora valbyensis NRRL Y-1626 TaxID=766949 RepID=A0A1B7TDW1_9ASCO|nr:hypothetical protein HANVADRAFT_39493 [Hanseniaspora valbyensis NRRL Y-1626]